MRTAKNLEESVSETLRAEKRFEYWIEEIAKYRELTDSIGGVLSSNTLDLWKQDIYCQYGIKFDESECPVPLMSEMAIDGLLFIEEKGFNVTYRPIRSDWVNDGQDREAWLDFEKKIREKAFLWAYKKPHIYESAHEKLLIERRDKDENGKAVNQMRFSGDVRLNVKTVKSMPYEKLSAHIFTEKPSVIKGLLPLR